MAEFKILQENGVDIYPITHPDAVRDENGNHAIVDAPSDGKTYGRNNGAWSEVQGGGGSTDWDEVYDVTLESAARLDFLPQKSVTKVYMYIKRPTGATSASLRLQIASDSVYAQGVLLPSFSVNLQTMITCTDSVIESISRVYNDAQVIYTSGAQCWADDWGAKNITRIMSTSNLDAGTRIVIKAKY